MHSLSKPTKDIFEKKNIESVNSSVSQTLKKEEFLALIGNLGIYQKNGRRAVHKPLLVLMALASVQLGKGPKLTFSNIEAKLERLIDEFGTTGKSKAAKAHYPFWYLRNDGFWELENAEELIPRKSKGLTAEPSIVSMRRSRLLGGFTAPAYDLLFLDPTVVEESAQRILIDNFPDSLRSDVLFAVGLECDIALSTT